MKKTKKKALPKIVTRAEWKRARAKLMTKEKAETRRRDALAAERRRLPMCESRRIIVSTDRKGKFA